MRAEMKKEIRAYLLIMLGSIMYAIGTVLFIFPHKLLLGGTSGISVILETYLPVSTGTILMVINFSLLILALMLLGKSMALKTFVGSTLTTVFIGFAEKTFQSVVPVISSCFLSAVLGAMIIALASAMMFYFDASSGGTDIIALVIKKYFKINIGKALLYTDFLIVIAGGFLSGYKIATYSLLGLLIKTFGIDCVTIKIKGRDKKIM